VAGAILTSAIPAAALTSGATLPRPLRAVAHALHLPVDSPAVADARAARDGLREALRCGDRPEVQQAATNLRDKLDALDEADRRTLDDDAARLLKLAGQAPGHRCDKTAAKGSSDANELTPPAGTSSGEVSGGDPAGTSGPDVGTHEAPAGAPGGGTDHDPSQPETTTTTEPKTTTTTEPETTTMA
jgi:hypothetical protein